MDQYIKELINQQPRAIVPELGAFITTPEGVMFNQYLSFDDGVLADYVAKAMGISQDEAREKVKAYVAEAKQRLSEGKDFVVDGVGVISNSEGKYEFVQDANATAGIKEQENIGLNNQSDNKKEMDNSNFDFTGGSLENNQPENNETNETKNESQEFVYEEDHSRRNIIIIAIIALLFLLGVILCLFVFNKDNCVYNFFFGEEEETKVETVVEPAPVAEDTTTVEVADTVVANPYIASEKRYNIVVGTYFKNEKAAQARVDQLKAKGFENAVVGTFRGNYVAIIDSYDRLPAAEARQEEIVDTYRIESFITNGGE